MSFKFRVQISAKAGCNKSVGWLGDRLKINVKAPAVDGRANEELIRLLAKRLEIHRAENAGFAHKLGRPWFHIARSSDDYGPAEVRLQEFVEEHSITWLKVAGPPESTEQGIFV